MTGAVSGVVLAAGLSTRFGAGSGPARSPARSVPGPGTRASSPAAAGAALPKQLFSVDGETLVRRICREALASGLAEVVLVTGHARRRVEAEVADLDLRAVHNPAYADGQSGSVRAGLGAVRGDAAGAMFLAVDQPGLDAAVIDLLLAAFRGPDSIVVPAFRGRRGAPVTFGRRWFGELERLRGDQGARPLLRSLARHVREAELDSPAPLEDVDTEGEARSWAAATRVSR